MTFKRAKELALEFGLLDTLADLWDMDEGQEEHALPYKTHQLIACGHCSALLERELRSNYKEVRFY
jgi:5'-3' exonuclease